MTWRWPITEPLFMDSHAKELVAKALSEPSKAQAFDTFTRYSAACACSRQLAYSALGVEPDETMDYAGQIVMDLGTTEHEKLQAAIERRFPGAQFEVPSRHGDLTSGHCDAYLPPYLLEIKTVGAYAFDKAIGLNRKARKLENPEGPKLSHIVQAGLNAAALGCSVVVIGYLSKEAVSAPLAEQCGMRPIDRILAEWAIPEENWRPLVEAELQRITDAASLVENGYLPERIEPDDRGVVRTLNPEATSYRDAGYWWRCNGYCGYRYRCTQDGPGVVPIPVGIGATR